ncbi:DUF4124 domain-containing protein [Photobacterium lipolyticum]|uniref:DUF4124 domain-containing protein n=1 Tax=Photobacterium lipolyticum TaxID=266810 RepID=A0A2T3MTW1_9GAMM|nr:DUF4124 domain-containing protein [Photobacterium lipolyticum]PSW03392.1 DUF4124 domain-containing protein [Photobacterium lipolyticum]
MHIPFILITLLSLLISPALQATTIYSWIDCDGVVHFSDQPTDKATVYQFDSLPSAASAASPTTSALIPSESTKTPDAAPAASIRLLSPMHEQTLRDNEGIIAISAIANRKMDQGHNVQLLLDGKAYGHPQSSLSWHLINIERGSHQLQVQLLKYGKVIASSKSITVYLHQASVIQRKPPAIKTK